MKAMWNNVVVATSEETSLFEGTYYFPARAISEELVIKSGRVFHCPKRGYGVYVDLLVNGNEKKDAAVYFAHPYPEAKVIADTMCFLYGVEIAE